MVRWYIWDSGDRVRVWYVYCVHMTKPRVLVRDVSSFGCIPSSLWIPSVVCLPFCCLVKWRQRGAWGPLLDRFWRSFPTASYRQHSKDSNSNISIAADLFVGWAVLFYSLKWVLATVRERFYFILYSYFIFLFYILIFIFLLFVLIFLIHQPKQLADSLRPTVRPCFPCRTNAASRHVRVSHLLSTSLFVAGHMAIAFSPACA